MITNNVVLVLGAGASKPYGFPVGNELVHEALYPGARAHIEIHNLDSQLGKVGVTAQDLERFRTELEASLSPSIDAFLETRQDFEDLGKKMIAFLLMHRENPERLFQKERDPENRETWYGYLFRLMYTPDWNDFGKNKLNIITFNYDRSLEYCLLRVLAATYRLERDACIEIMEKHIPIVHLHGTLGDLYGTGEDVREYEAKTSSENLMKAVRKIQIVHEVDSGESQFGKAHEILKDAEHVLFLGFGYHHENVLRLNLENHCPKATLWGTCKGFTEGERQRSITSQIPKLKGRHLRDESVIELLRHKPADIFGPDFWRELHRLW